MSSSTGDKACRASVHSGSGVARKTKPKLKTKTYACKKIIVLVIRLIKSAQQLWLLKQRCRLGPNNNVEAVEASCIQCFCVFYCWVLSLCTCWVLFIACAHTTYSTALIFCRSKFWLIAVLKEFVEKKLKTCEYKRYTIYAQL